MALTAARIDYVFLGEELGGRPSDNDCYDADGHVLYSKLAETDRFRDVFDDS
jgi:hypothetical protein